MRNVKLVSALALLGLLVVFSIQNAELLQVNFLLWSFEMRRALILFLVLAIGIILGWVLHSFRRASQKSAQSDSDERRQD